MYYAGVEKVVICAQLPFKQLGAIMMTDTRPYRNTLAIAAIWDLEVVYDFLPWNEGLVRLTLAKTLATLGHSSRMQQFVDNAARECSERGIVFVGYIKKDRFPVSEFMTLVIEQV